MEENSEESVLNLEGVNVYNAEVLEKDVIEKINKNIEEKEKAEVEKKSNGLINQLRSLASLLRQNESAIKFFSDKPQSEAVIQKLSSLKIQNQKYRSQINALEAKLQQLKKRSTELSNGSLDASCSTSTTYDKSKVSAAKSLKERKELIKKGLATPFSLHKETTPAATQKIKPPIKLDDAFGNFLSGGLVENTKQAEKQTNESKSAGDGSESTCSSRISPTRKRPALPITGAVENKQRRKSAESDEDYQVPSEDFDLEDSDEYDTDVKERIAKVNLSPSKRQTARSYRERRVCDDANPKAYKKRMLRHKQQLLREQTEGIVPPGDKALDGGLKVPGKTWKKLYKYQQTGVKWLWELHSQQAGGILGDEMGLGKTIQVIAFLDALRHSKVRDRDSSYSYNGLGPVLIVSPTTVMHQWVRELHLWAPLLRVAVLHNSGSYKGAKADLIHNIALSHGVLITSYERMRISLDALIGRSWHYVILDEGHKIRNPEAAITHAIKMFQTPHRIILSGSPIQNHLRELWSLFDFIFPGKLGTLQCFMEQFSVPIVQGGYANASEVQVQTAYKCACVLRDTIAPYLLRRMKVDVQCHINLPKKNDHVLFCSLTDHQIDIYKRYLDSETVYSILCRNMKIFVGLIQLRKICNHPDLYTGGPKLLVGEPEPPLDSERKYGFWKRSGKMIVIDSLLRIWKKQNKKVLLFTQSKLMLNVLEDFVKLRNYSYMTMHGGTPVQSRQPLVKKFNEDPSVFVFILTTRVGGLGVNLVGADRVVIFDPDWNPSTDAQAQERSWRIGQDKEVTIYRLITTGTIEEKIYHRQIFKQFMSNRVLKDPKQRRFFKTNDIHELFTLQQQSKDGSQTVSETASIFAGTGSEIKPWKLKARLRAQKAMERQRRERHFDGDDASTSAAANANHSKAEVLQSKNSKPTDLNKSDFFAEKPTSSANLRSDVNHHGTDDVTCAPSGDSASFDAASVDNNGVAQRQSVDIPQVGAEEPSGSRDDGHCDATEPGRGESKKIKESFMKVLLKFQEAKRKSVQSRVSETNRKRKKCDVDGEIVDYVTKKSTYKPRSEEETSRKNSDEYVLSKLFKKGVHTAMKHGVIMDSSTPDYALVESEADRVAKEAIKILKLSRKHYRYPASKSTQRPRFGRGGGAKAKPMEKKDESSEDETPMGAGNAFGKSDAGVSSANILKQIKTRTHQERMQRDAQESASSDEGDLHLLPSDDEDFSDDDKLLRQIVSFLAEDCDGEATTDEIMSKFEGHVETRQAPKFRAMLLKICDKSKRNGATRWRLKPEFY